MCFDMKLLVFAHTSKFRLESATDVSNGINSGVIQVDHRFEWKICWEKLMHPICFFSEFLYQMVEKENCCQKAITVV